MLRYQCVFLLCLLAYSCVEDEKAGDANVIDIREDSRIVGSLNYDDPNFAESCTLVKLEANEQSLLSRIGRVEVYKDRIYIQDRDTNKLLVFNMDGSFSHRIGQQGRGPGEYLSITAFYINPDKGTVTILDNGTATALTYSLDNNYLGRKDGGPGVTLQGIVNASYLGNGQIACYADPTGLMDEIMFILNEEDLSFAEILVSKPFDIAPMVFTVAENTFSIIDGELHYVELFNNSICSYKKGVTETLLTIDSGKKIVPEKVLKKKAESLSGEFFRTIIELLKDGKYSTGLRNLYETNRFIFCEFPNESYASSLLVFDKQTNESVYMACDRMTEMFLGFKNMRYANGDILVSEWRRDDIERLVDCIDRGIVNAADFDADVLDMALSYGEQDNPILLLYKMKK